MSPLSAPAPAPAPAGGSLAIGDQPSQPAADTACLQELIGTLCQDERRFLGFPDHLPLVTGELAPLLAAFTHQPADPYSPTPVGVATRAYQEAVVEYFAAVAGVSTVDVQGHVTSSPYEALLHGLATAHRRLPAAPVYVGEQAHACARRACELLGLNLVSVKSRPDGTMDPEDLRQQTRRRRGAGALVVATCGTPLHGAVDDVAALRAAVADCGPVRVHVDAAAGGLVAAHSDEVPPWSLAHGAHSITLSGHGLLGLPVPAGISLVRRAHASAAGARIAVCDPPVAGVGGGLAALLLWTRLRSLGRAGVAAMIGRCQDLAVHAVHRLEHAGARPHRVPGSLAVTFDRPPAWVVDKWHLAHAGDRARIVAMGPVTYTAVNELADDLTVAGCKNAA